MAVVEMPSGRWAARFTVYVGTFPDEGSAREADALAQQSRPYRTFRRWLRDEYGTKFRRPRAWE